MILTKPKKQLSMPKPKEKTVHQQVCDYLTWQYPEIIFTSDASGLRVSMGLRMELKRKRCVNYVIPDLIILHPSGNYHGLLIEIKKDEKEIYNKAGQFKSDNNHIKAQLTSLLVLTNLGYRAEFGCGFEDCKRIIDEYLKTSTQIFFAKTVNNSQ